MIIIFRPEIEGTYQPVVILDYTRSDEQWNEKQINNYVKEFTPEDTINLKQTIIYSLDYDMAYSHNGVVYGDALKTQFECKIINAPIGLINLINIQQFTSQQNLEALEALKNAVIDPQIKFPSGGFVLKSSDSRFIKRRFIIYSTPFNFDSRRINSTLYLRGAEFDTMVMRLKFSMNIKKGQGLIPQLRAILSTYNITTNSNGISETQEPVIAKYYQPGPIDTILNEVCQDNKIGYNRNNGIINFQSLSPNAPPSQIVLEKLSFANIVGNTKLISTFSLNNYASCNFKSEIFDINLYSSIAVYNDSLSQGLFQPLVKIPGSDETVGSNTISAYRFYVQAYKFIDSKYETSVSITGTNNWLVTNFKIDSLLENAIYKNQLGQ